MFSHKFVRASWINWQNFRWPKLAGALGSALVGPSATLRAAGTREVPIFELSFSIGWAPNIVKGDRGAKSPKTKNSFSDRLRPHLFLAGNRPRSKSSNRLNHSYDMLSNCGCTMTISISTDDRGRIFVKSRTTTHQLDDVSNLIKSQLMGNWRPIGNQMVNLFRHCWVSLVLLLRSVS